MSDTLNPEQRRAVTYTDSPLLIIAGAGSGKTRVLTEKINHLITNHLIPADKIFAVTFTNKAASEMQDRISSLTTADTAKQLNISTFHTLGLKLIREQPELFERKKGFSILDSGDSINVIKDIMRRDFGDPDNLAERVRWQISEWKQSTADPLVEIEASSNPIIQTARSVYVKYQDALRTFNVFDFDDLILAPLRALQTNPELRARWQYQIRYLLVDEYQDTNLVQYEFIKQLVGIDANFTVVGDDDQSIYAWRGARPENLNELKVDYPNLEVIKLEQNYRSSTNILTAANAVIANNPHIFEKRLWSQLGAGEQIEILACQNDEQEALQVIAQLMQNKFQNRRQYSDYAILYRGNHQSRLFEQQLREKDIPYYLSGGLSFFAYSEIKDVMSYLRVVCNPDDENALLRIINTPRRELGTSTVKKIADHASKFRQNLFASMCDQSLSLELNKRAFTNASLFKDWVLAMHHRIESESPTALVKAILDDVDYAKWITDSSPDEIAANRKLRNVQDLLDWIDRIYKKNPLETNLIDIINKLALIDVLERDKEKDKGNSVQLMTLHAAKGLEFPNVFLVGVEENILPHRTSIEEDSIEEERRLAYVGITRAKQQLTISYALQRKRYGESEVCEPSRFLAEIPEELMIKRGQNSETTKEERQEYGKNQLAGLRAMLGRK